MIQPVGHNYNINFKAAKMESINQDNIPKQVIDFIYRASNTPDIQKHLEVLNRYGIRLEGFRADKNKENRVLMCYNIDTIGLDCEKGTLTMGAIGEINNLQDARGLVIKTIQEAWSFFLENASGYYFHR